MGRDMDICASATRDGLDHDGNPSPWQFFNELTEFTPPVHGEYYKTFDRTELIACMQTTNDALLVAESPDDIDRLRTNLRFYGFLMYHMNKENYITYSYE